MIAVSILHYNSPNSLEDVIKAVKAQTLLPSIILVLDNGSSSNIFSVKEKYPELDYLELGENQGVGYGHNYAWKYLIERYSPEFIWALEHDSIPEPNNLKLLLGEFKRSKSEVMAVNSVEKNGFNYKKFSYYKVRIPNVVKLEDKDLVSNYYGGLSFNGVLIPVSTFGKIGFLREDFFIGFEDIEYTKRIYKAGGKILRITNSFVFHDIFKNYYSVLRKDKIYLFPGNDPDREYYSFRNSLVVHRKFGFYFVKLILSSCYILLFRKRKIANMSAKFLGYFDAINFRMGRRDYKILKLNW